jgi:predicted methyltransferase
VDILSTRKLLIESKGVRYTTDDKFIYAEKDGTTVRLDLFAGHYYKLRPFNGIPILEIDGLRMQLVKDFKTPLEYAKKAVEGLKIPDSGDFTALDTCMGLGYTAIELSKKRSVRLVATCELSEAVIALAKWNPYSDALFEKGGKIVILEGSALEHAKSFDSLMFDFIIHDPPRFSHAPELYSPDFYRQLFRISKKGARIFHYVGSVGKTKGRDIGKEVEKRLIGAGFRILSRNDRLQGLFAQK